VFIGFADEVFVRGWLQAGCAVRQKLGEWSLPVLASGLFAGSMYLTLMKQRARGRPSWRWSWVRRRWGWPPPGCGAVR
jgi:hypothetical protein